MFEDPLEQPPASAGTPPPKPRPVEDIFATVERTPAAPVTTPPMALDLPPEEPLGRAFEPVPWYRRVWVWLVAGLVVAAAVVAGYMLWGGNLPFITPPPATLPPVTATPAVNETPPQIEAPPVDSDGDGLSDSEERALGTNPNNSDTDGDGLFDREEVRVYQTEALQPDTDGDGFNDGTEVKNGYNPKGPGRLLELPNP